MGRAKRQNDGQGEVRHLKLVCVMLGDPSGGEWKCLALDVFHNQIRIERCHRLGNWGGLYRDAH